MAYIDTKICRKKKVQSLASMPGLFRFLNRVCGDMDRTHKVRITKNKKPF